MRVMIFAKSSPEREQQPNRSGDMADMVRFTEELEAAGVLLGQGALESSNKGVRVRFEGGSQSIVDGPFTDSAELVAGYWLWQVRSLDEAIEWLRRAPFPDGMELELRPVLEMPEGMPGPDDA
jgi:hypothetical protein